MRSVLFFVYWAARRSRHGWCGGRDALGHHGAVVTSADLWCCCLPISIASFLLEPVGDAFSRHFEHQADVYGQEAIHGIVPTRRRPPWPRSMPWGERGWKIPIRTRSSSSGSTAIPAWNSAPTLPSTTTRGRTVGHGKYLQELGIRDQGSKTPGHGSAEFNSKMRGGAHAAANAHRDHAVAHLPAFHLSRSVAVSFAPVQPRGWPSAMAPPFTLTRVGIEIECADDGQRLRGKRLVQFDEADVVEREAGLRERLGYGGDGADAHLFGQAAGDGVGDKAGERLNPELARACAASMSTAAAAPSEVCEELPAVTVPCAWKAGLSWASASAEVSARGPSSAVKARSTTGLAGLCSGRPRW